MYSALSLLLAASPAVWAAPMPQGVCAPLLPSIYGTSSCKQPPSSSAPPQQYNSIDNFYAEMIPSSCFNIQSAVTASDGSPMYLTIDFAGNSQTLFTTIAKPIPNWINYTMHTINGQQTPVGSTQKFCAKNNGRIVADNGIQCASIIVNGALDVGNLAMLGYLAYNPSTQTSSTNPFNTYPLPGGPNTTDLWYTLSYQSQALGWFAIVPVNWPASGYAGGATPYLEVNMAMAGQPRMTTRITSTGQLPGHSMTWTTNPIPGNWGPSQFIW